jgi:hypothetical protein
MISHMELVVSNPFEIGTKCQWSYPTDILQPSSSSEMETHAHQIVLDSM